MRPRAAKMFQRHFLALFSRKICFCNSEVIFRDNGVKIGESVYFCIRIKIIKVNYWPKVAFYPLKLHFFILGFSRSSCKKGHRKANIRPMTLIFWQKMPHSILLSQIKWANIIVFLLEFFFDYSVTKFSFNYL